MKYWVFDLDGTLVDSLTAHFQVLDQVFKNFGVPFSEKDYHEVLKISAKVLPHYFEKKLGHERAQTGLELFHKLSVEAFKTMRAFDGIENLLQTLQSRGASLAIWTARDLEATEKILNYTGLKPYFSICISGTCVSQGKPHPEGLQKIAEHFGSNKNSMVMVGDFESDMLGAQAFGTKAVRVYWHTAVPVQNCKIADWQFTQVKEFQNWVESLPILA
jgi:HAD superfamily hydrolase (TIGR01549 family)